jgi:RNA-directed DNA polymerase
VSSTKPFGITKRMVLEAYRRVRANQGAAGIDGVSLKMFEADLSANLYKLWNRLASGSYFPPPVQAVEIEKKSGGVRVLGVPTVADRIAQTVIKARIEGELEQFFHPDSYGYRPNKSAADAVAVIRERNWKHPWVVEFDIKRAFDELSWKLIRRLVHKHVKEPWALLYIERWLTVPMMTKEGTLVPRSKGTPQGGVISPMLMNLVMHYVFDEWMRKEQSQCSFVRYADDAVVHCRSDRQAKFLLMAIEWRLKEYGLSIHPQKSSVVYCQSSRRGRSYPKTQFTFLGFTFRPRGAISPEGKLYTGFLPAASPQAIKEMMREMRSWKLPQQTSASLYELAERYNPVLRGWMNYYGCFYRTAIKRVFGQFDRKLAQWARRKYRGLARHKIRSFEWLAKAMGRQPRLFDHWLIFNAKTVRTMGAV